MLFRHSLIYNCLAGQAICLLCGREGLRVRLRTDKSLIAACPDCGLSQTVDGRSEADLAALYDEDYALAQPDRPDGVQRERYERLLRLALARRPPPARRQRRAAGADLRR